MNRMIHSVVDARRGGGNKRKNQLSVCLEVPLSDWVCEDLGKEGRMGQDEAGGAFSSALFLFLIMSG